MVRGPALVESAAGLVVAALIVVAWYGAGAPLRRLIDGRWPARRAPLEVAITCALGAGAWSLAWFFIGVAGGYVTRVALATLVFGLVLAGLAVARATPRATAADAGAPTARWQATAIAAAVLLVVALVIAGVAALAPPTAKDTLQYHLALPQAFIEAGRLTVVGESIVAYSPLGAEMHGLWAMLVGRVVSPRVGEAAFGATMFAFLPLLLAFVHGWAAESRSWPLIAAALVATVPVVIDVASSGYVDLALALLLAVAVRAAARWWTSGAPRALATLALASGFALGVKVLAIFPFATLALVALLGARRAGARVGVTLLALAGAVVVGAPWYVRTWALTGSPFFPYYLDLWPGHAPGWDVARSAMVRAFNDAYGGGKDPLALAVLPFRVSLMGQREVAAYYENVLGVAFLAAVPAVVWALWRRRAGAETAVVTAVAAVMFVWWAASAQVMRYLVPVLPLAAVVAVRAAAALAGETASSREASSAGRWLRAAMLLPAAAAMLVGVTWFLADAPMFAVTGAESRAEYLSRRLDYYPYYRIIDEQLPRDARVWLIDVRRDTYHLTRSYRGDYLFEDYTLREHLRNGFDDVALRRWARREGITHVFVRHDILFDPARSVLVDDRLPHAENVARLGRVRDFLLDGTRVLGGDRKFLLVALP